MAQTISACGALSLGAEFLKLLYHCNDRQVVYLADPTWSNHPTVFKGADLEVRRYRYFDKETNRLDLFGMLEDLENAPDASIIVLQACGQNPTRIDPSREQWMQIERVMRKRGILLSLTLYRKG